MAGNMTVPDSVMKMIVDKLVNRLDRIGSQITDEQRAEIESDLLAWSPNDFTNTLALPAPVDG